MKLLHTSDWHLGINSRGSVSFEQDQIFFIEEIIRIARDKQADGILIAGDIFDKSIASREALTLYDEKISYICGELNIPVYIIAGNHDGAERLSQCNELLKKSGLYIAGALKAAPYVVNQGDVDIYLLPWISTDKVKAVYPEKSGEIASMEDAYRVVLDEYRSQFEPGRTNILVAHAFIANAKTSVSDKAAEVGFATMVGTSVFEGFDYVALGHLHGPQQVSDTIRYSGTPMAYSFGREEAQEKSITIFDTESKELEIIPLPQRLKRTTLKGTFEELMAADFDEKIVKGYVRLEVTDSFVGLDLIAAFRERYPNLLEISGKSFENEDARITMTIEEFEQADNDPETVFLRYCEDIVEKAPTEHILDMFRRAERGLHK